MQRRVEKGRRIPSDEIESYRQLFGSKQFVAGGFEFRSTWWRNAVRSPSGKLRPNQLEPNPERNMLRDQRGYHGPTTAKGAIERDLFSPKMRGTYGHG